MEALVNQLEPGKMIYLLILAHRRQKQVNNWVGGHPGVPREFYSFKDTHRDLASIN